MERPACPMCGGGEASAVCEGLRDLLAGKPGEFALVRCAACSLAFLSPRPVRSAIGFYYEGVYDAAAERLQFGVIAGFADRARLRDLEARRPIAPGHRHLDVGCGFGAFVLRLARTTGASAVAVDFGRAQVESVTRRAAAGGLAIEAREGELAAQALDSGSFGTASLLHYLEHSYDPVADLRAVHRLLADGGAVVVEVPSVDALGLSLFGKFWAVHLAPQHLTAWSAATLARALRDAGFREVRVKNGYLPFLLLLSVLQWWHWNIGGASRFKKNVLIANVFSAAFFLAFGIPLILADLLAGPLVARAGRGEVLRATAVK